MSAHADNARKADSPWRGAPTVTRSKPRKKKLTECEALTGRTAEQLRVEQVRLRAAALQRFGKTAA